MFFVLRRRQKSSSSTSEETASPPNLVRQRNVRLLSLILMIAVSLFGSVVAPIHGHRPSVSSDGCCRHHYLHHVRYHLYHRVQTPDTNGLTTPMQQTATRCAMTFSND